VVIFQGEGKAFGLREAVGNTAFEKDHAGQ
jgi:hypothetical protein